jgi:hypothetical protein
MSSDADKTSRVNNVYIDKYLDSLLPLCDKRNINWVHISRPPSKIFGANTFSCAYSINKRYFFAILLDLVNGISLEIDEQRFRSKSHRIKLFKKILLNLNPSVILTIDYLAEICIAAEDLKIPLVEVLHGKGYSLDPKYWLYRGPKRNIHPKYVICYDQITTDLIKLTQPDIELLQVEDLSLRLFHSRSLEKSRQPNLPKNVLVTLQWGYAGEIESLIGVLKDGVLPNGLLAAINIAGNNVHWTLRLHPVQIAEENSIYVNQKKYLFSLFRSFKNVKLELEHSKFIYESLSASDIHLTVSSMSAYDAAQVGKITLLTDSLRDPEFTDLIEKKWAFRINDDGESIFKWVMNSPTPPQLKYSLNSNSVTAEELINRLLNL